MAIQQQKPLNSVKVELTGNVVRDPQSIVTRSGNVIKITLACNDVYNGTEPKTWWVDCIFMKECANLAQDYRQGDLISVSGLLQPSRIKGTWTDSKSGVERPNNDVCIITPEFKKEGEMGTILPMQVRYKKPLQQKYNQSYVNSQVPEPSTPLTYVGVANQQVAQQQQIDFQMNQQKEEELRHIMTQDTPPLQPTQPQSRNSYAIDKEVQQPQVQHQAQPKASIETVVASKNMTKSDIQGFMN